MKLARLACMGDSLTYGFGVPRLQVWPHLSQERLGVEVVNAGVNGDTTAGMLARLERDVFARSPSHVLIMGGGNDIFATGSAVAARAGLWGLIHQVMAYGAVPMLGLPPRLSPAGIPPQWAAVVGDTAGAERAMEELNTWIRSTAAGFGLGTVDFSACLDSAPGLRLDGIHPTAEGHRRMAEVLCGTLMKMR